MGAARTRGKDISEVMAFTRFRDAADRPKVRSSTSSISSLLLGRFFPGPPPSSNMAKFKWRRPPRGRWHAFTSNWREITSYNSRFYLDISVGFILLSETAAPLSYKAMTDQTRLLVFFSCLFCKAVYYATQKRKPSAVTVASLAKGATRRCIGGGAPNTVLRIGEDRLSYGGRGVPIRRIAAPMHDDPTALDCEPPAGAISGHLTAP